MKDFRLLLLICFCLPIYSTFAAIEPVSNRIQGDDVKINSFLTTSDNKFNFIMQGNWIQYFDVQSSDAKVVFGIDESSTEFKNKFKYEVELAINYDVLENGVIVNKTAANQILEVYYDPARGTQYIDRDIRSFYGALRLQFEVRNIRSYNYTSQVWETFALNDGLPNYLYLETEIETERYYVFNQSATPSSDLTFNIINGELIVHWPFIEGAEYYDLEWTWVSGYSGNMNSQGNPEVLPASNLDYNFKDNATRIRTEGANTYSIPLIYGDGYIVLRYRGVGLGGENHTVPLEGNWNMGHSSAVGSTPNHILVTAHEQNNINYGAGISFIENGVKSVGVTYMDGVLKARQSQAKLNSQDKIIAGSTIYDHYGRPAIGVMSTPVNQSELGYVENLNMYDATTPYGKQHFDYDVLPSTLCGEFNTTPPMDPLHSVGAANYYSENNPDKEGSNAYLPNAKGYPFAQVKYSNDPTGRIKRVGGVGPDHQFGKTNIDGSTKQAHYTEYYYTTPDDLELFKLFGNDVSSPQNYTKIITKDVHGQLSIALVDPMGRTIATYLTGPSPNNLEALSDNNGNSATGKDFMLYNTIDDIEGVLSVQHPLVVADPTLNYSFEYDFTAVKYTECLPVDLCFDCIYEVEIRIIPEEYNHNCHITDENGVWIDVDANDNHNPYGAVIKTYTVGSLTNLDINCSIDDITFSGENTGEESFIVKFPTSGSYQVIKTLKVAEAPIDFYWEEYLENNTCLTPYSSFLNEALDNINPEYCDETDACLMTAYRKLGSKQTWIEQYLIDNINATVQTADDAYVETLTDLTTKCYGANSCDIMYETMVNDFKLGGQYALPNTVEATSIFNSSSLLFPQGHDITTYLVDELGNPLLVDIDGDGIKDTPVDAVGSINDIINNWEDDWAYLFVELHPEYCYYKFCDDVNDFNYFDYENEMLAFETYDEACAAGYINPIASTIVSGFNFTGCPNAENDMVMNQFDSQSYYYQDIMQILNTYNTPGTGPSNIYEYAIQMAGNDFNTVAFDDPCYKDLHWQMFRNLYLSLRFQVIELLKEEYVSDPLRNCSQYVHCIGEQGFCQGTTAFENKIKRYITFETGMDFDLNSTVFNPATAGSIALAEIDDDCLSQCEGLADLWMIQLQGCAANLPSGETWQAGQTTYDLVRQELINVCAGGCGPEWPAPAQNYTLATVSTNYPAKPQWTPAFNSSPTFNSFQTVIEYFLGQETAECTHLSIVSPGVNHGNESLSSPLTKCACDLLLPTTSAQDFYDQYGYEVNNYAFEKCGCEQFDTNIDDDVLDATEANNLNNAAIPTHNFFPSCDDVCMDCNDLFGQTGLINSFNNQYGDYVDFPILFEAFVNEAKGSYYEYHQILALIENCDALTNPSPTKILNFIDVKAEKIRDLLIKLNANDITPNAPINYTALTLPEYFTTSLYAPCQTEINTDVTDAVNHNFDYNPFVTNTSIEFIITGQICVPPSTCTLTVSTHGSLVGYSNISELLENTIQFGDVYHLSNQLNVSTLDEFYIDILVTDPNGDDIITSIKVKSCYQVIEEYTPTSSAISFRICGSTVSDVDEPTSCLDDLISQAEISASEAYEEYLAEQYIIFRQNYISTCTYVIDEKFEESHFDNSYQYTLMYYDLAGNLVKTVPPEAVYAGKLDAADAADAADYYNGNLSTPKYPAYALDPTNQYYNDDYVTTYQYNTLNQILKANTPDGGLSRYWYDKYGRLVLSQNAKQAAFNTNLLTGDFNGSGTNVPAYSYTLYDDLGRVIEVGEIINMSQVSILPNDFAKDETQFNSLVGNSSILNGTPHSLYKRNVTQIIYDNPYSNEAELFFGNGGAGDTRNRITAVLAYNDYVEKLSNATDWVFPDPEYVNHYSYDVHGNVKTYLQEINTLADHHNRFRRTDYDYDLISGNPNYIHFQKGKPDQYSHHYVYDKDNRLSEVYTSDDGEIWDRDANYEYREDGYLARTELGEMKVQGMDYAYTLQGWLKTLNSGTLKADYDMGKDGENNPSAQYSNLENNIHGRIAKDVLAYTLGYYNGDYEAISDGMTGYSNMQLNINGTPFEQDINDLYNGNITSLVTNLTDLVGEKLRVNANTFHYDQMHRFKEMHVFSDDAANVIGGNDIGGAQRMNLNNVGGYDLADHEVHVNYKRDGDIEKLIRMAHTDNGGAHDNLMDDFTYEYETGTHKLLSVDDGITTTATLNFGDIQHGQEVNLNYEYHPDGSLKRDDSEGIEYIDWYPNGKIKRIYRYEGHPAPDLYFEYDAMGIRTLKTEIPKSEGGTPLGEEEWKHTYYANDANGTTLGIYEYNENGMPGSGVILAKTESMMYGGSRLGVNNEYIKDLDEIGDYSTRCNTDGLQSAIVVLNYTYINNLGAGTDIEIKLNGVNLHSNIAYDNTQEFSYLCLALKQAIELNNPDLMVNLLTVDGTDYYLEIKEVTAGALEGDISYFVNASNLSSFYIARQTTSGNCFAERKLGLKNYELANHLGNVMEVITDRKIEVENTSQTGTIAFFEADVSSYSDYYPYGMQMTGRNGQGSQNYRYAFNGMEQDKEVSGNGNSYTTQFRQYDPRLGRWKSLDPLAAKYASMSPYIGMGNNPMFYTDPLGLEPNGGGDTGPRKGSEGNPHKIGSLKQARDLADKKAMSGDFSDEHFETGAGKYKAVYEDGAWQIYQKNSSASGGWKSMGNDYRFKGKSKPKSSPASTDTDNNNKVKDKKPSRDPGYWVIDTRRDITSAPIDKMVPGDIIKRKAYDPYGVNYTTGIFGDYQEYKYLGYGMFEKTKEFDQIVEGDLLAEAAMWVIPVGRVFKIVGKGIKLANVAKNGSNAFDIALAGGKHSGFLKNYLGRSPDQINKAINTLQTGKRGINIHLDKIANPSKYVPNWNALRPEHQQSLIRGWQKEITNGTEQIEILRGILGN